MSSLEGVANLADEYAADNGGSSSWKTETGFKDGYTALAPIGSFRPNAFGLHDVHGNVWEWCFDGYGFYNRSPALDLVSPPTDPATRVYRGGGFDFTATSARSASRNLNTTAYAVFSLGLRPARVATK